MEPFGSHILARKNSLSKMCTSLQPPAGRMPRTWKTPDPSRIEPPTHVIAQSELPCRTNTPPGNAAFRQQAKPSPGGVVVLSHFYDVLALKPIAEESLWGGRQAIGEEWVLCDSILSPNENRPANPLFAVTNRLC